MKIEIGFLWDTINEKIYLSGPFLYVEPKLKASKNTVIGLRIGAALNTQAIKNSDPFEFYIGKNYNSNNVAISLIPTFDYYFAKNKFRPYLGLGVGYYFLTTSKKAFVGGNFIDAVEVSINNKMGILIRGGLDLNKVKVGRLDLSKFTVGLEFNYIPKADIEIPNGQKIGTISNSNIALSIGHIIGNGKS
ncbi:MAG: OmpW family outer membrane protein [Saprospiraceae bacterium]